MSFHAHDDFTQRLLPLHGMLVVLARRLVDDRADAEDVLQAALESAYRHRERFDPETNFRAWISRFLVHEAANANRRRSRRKELRIESIDSEEELSASSPVDELAAEERWEECLRRPERLVENLDQDLARALRALGENERVALLLHAVSDLRCSEIARTLDVPAGTVMSWLYRARLAIRRRLMRSQAHVPGVEKDTPRRSP